MHIPLIEMTLKHGTIWLFFAQEDCAMFKSCVY